MKSTEPGGCLKTIQWNVKIKIYVNEVTGIKNESIDNLTDEALSGLTMQDLNKKIKY